MIASALTETALPQPAQRNWECRQFNCLGRVVTFAGFRFGLGSFRESSPLLAFIDLSLLCGILHADERYFRQSSGWQTR